MDDTIFDNLPPYNPVSSKETPPLIDLESDLNNIEDDSAFSSQYTGIKKTSNYSKSIFSGAGFKSFVAILGISAVVVGSLAAKGIIVLGSAAASLLAAKILIPVGCVILVVLLAKLIFDAVKHCLRVG